MVGDVRPAAFERLGPESSGAAQGLAAWLVPHAGSSTLELAGLPGIGIEAHRVLARPYGRAVGQLALNASGLGAGLDTLIRAGGQGLVEAEQTCDTEEAFYSLADIAINDAIYQTLGDRLGLRPRERVVLRYSKQGEDALPRIAEALRIHETDAYILWKLVYWKTEEPTLTDLQQDVRDWLEQGKGTTEIAKMLDRDRMQISRLITTINTKLGTGYSGKGKKHNELLALAAAPEDDLRTIGLSQVHITAVRAYGNGVADHVTAPTLGIHTRAVTVKRAEALERLRHGPPTPLSSLRWKRMYWASDNGD